jgi:flagellar hook-associated protein 1 FlgK
MSDLSLEIAATGLDADQAELDTASNNLSNVATPGYAEEVVNLNPESSGTVTGVGDGVTIGSVTENSSSLYDQINLLAQGQLGAANESASILNLTQSAFPAAGTTGLDAQLGDLWGDLSTLATEPSSVAAQQTVVNDAKTIANTLNATYAQLSDIAGQLANDLGGQGTTNGGLVGQANQAINQIAALNGKIVGGQSGGLDVNTLIDEQRSAVNQLGTLLGVNTTTAPNGTMTVTSGGVELVSGTNGVDLQTTGSATAGNLAVETTTDDLLPAGGQIGALVSGVNTTIPTYQSGLSSISDALATTLNTLQAGGVSADGTPGPASAAAAPPYSGALLPSIFVNNASSTTYTTGATSAATIAVNPTLLASPSELATALGSSPAGTATIDPTTAQAMAAVGQDVGGPDDLYSSLIDLVGSQTSQANNNQTATQALSDATTADVSSVEGVDTNQQTVSLLAAQQDYQAVAEVINATTTALNSLLAAV